MEVLYGAEMPGRDREELQAEYWCWPHLLSSPAFIFPDIKDV
jgi:hypothetical protein